MTGVFFIKQPLMTKFKGILAQSGIFSKLLIIIGGTCFFTSLGIIVWAVITGGDATRINSLKILQLCESIGMFMMPPLVLAYFWGEKPFDYLHLEKKMRGSDAGFVILFMVLIIPFVNLLSDFNQQLVLPKELAGLETWMKATEMKASQLTEKLLYMNNVQSLFFNIFLIAMIPAIGEELFFRGLLQRVFLSWKSAVMAIWLTAFVFSAIHLQFYGFLPRLLLGAFFGYLLVWSGTLWLPILAHFTNNLLAVVFFYLKQNGFLTINMDTIGAGNTLWLGYVSGALAIVLIFLLKERLRLKAVTD